MYKPQLTYEAIYTHPDKPTMSMFIGGVLYHIDEYVAMHESELLDKCYTRLGIYKVENAFIEKTKGIVELERK